MEANYSNQPGANQGANQRAIEFRDEIAGMQLRTPVDSQERRWLVASMALVAIGLVLILAGWWGASGTPSPAKQTPYLISGGLLGLGVVVTGAALFVRYSLSRYLRFWLVRSIYEQRAQTDREVEVLERLEALLLAAVRTRAQSGQPAPQATNPNPNQF